MCLSREAFSVYHRPEHRSFQDVFMPQPAGTPPAPSEIVMQMATGYWIGRALYVTTELGIPDLLADGPKNCTGLAASTKTHPLALYRVLRALAMVGVYVETGPRQFGLTPLSEVLRSDVPGSMRPMVLFQGDPLHAASYGEMRYSLETSRPAVEKAFGLSVFEYMRQNPEAGTRFNQAMTTHSQMEAGAVLAVPRSHGAIKCALLPRMDGFASRLAANIPPMPPATSTRVPMPPKS